MYIKIAFIEDDPRLRSNLQTYFEMVPEFKVVFTCGSVESGLETISQYQELDILVLDIGLPGMNGIEGIQHFKELKPEIDIAMLTSYEEEEKILKALCAGACSYISKKSRLQDIADALLVVHRGGSFMSPSIAREIVHYFSKNEAVKKEKLLTERQTEIMDLMIKGLTYAAIAKQLLVSTETVKSHIKKIYSTLHVNNKAEAIARYMKD